MGRGRQRLIGPRDGGRGDGTGAAAVDRAGGSEVAMENGSGGLAVEEGDRTVKIG
jgi:hypothetical protein